MFLISVAYFSKTRCLSHCSQIYRLRCKVRQWFQMLPQFGGYRTATFCLYVISLNLGYIMSFIQLLRTELSKYNLFKKNTCQSNKELIHWICFIFNTCRNKCFVVFSLISNFTHATEDTYVQVSLMKAKKWQYRY